MTKDEIIAIAKESGMEVHERKGKIRIGSAVLTGCDSTEQVERFAALVAAAEREACAQVCDELHSARSVGGFPREASASRHLAFAIRARGAA